MRVSLEYRLYRFRRRPHPLLLRDSPVDGKPEAMGLFDKFACPMLFHLVGRRRRWVEVFRREGRRLARWEAISAFVGECAGGC